MPTNRSAKASKLARRARRRTPPKAGPVVRSAIAYMPLRAPGVPALMRGEVEHPVLFDNLPDASAPYWAPDDWIGGEHPTGVARVEIRFLDEWPIDVRRESDPPLAMSSTERKAQKRLDQKRLEEALAKPDASKSSEPTEEAVPVARAVVGEWDVDAPDWPKLDPGVLSVSPRADGPVTYLRHAASAHEDQLTITVGDESGRPVIRSVRMTGEGSLRIVSRLEGEAVD